MTSHDRTYRRILTAVLAALMLATVTVGCSSSDQQSSKEVGVVVKTLSQPFWLYMKAGAESAATAGGAQAEVTGATEEAAVQEQVDKTRAMISRSVSALVVAPTEPKQLQPILQQAVDQGIPVVLVDTDIPDWHAKTSFVGTDNLAAGKVGGQYALTVASSGNLAILAGTPGNTATQDRVTGFKQAVNGSGLNVVAELSANSDRAQGRSVTADILQRNPDLSMIFAANDEMALGAVQAVDAAGKAGQVKIIGFDGTKDAVDAILAGTMAGSVAQNPFKMGEAGVQAAIKASNGQSVDKRIDTGSTMVTRDNAADFKKELEQQLAGS
ncbi:sugar ABC transporter substrate-binding protein [Mycolicibacterium sp. P1-18]|uniref:sugar ABC transporter substrate-binding protein n=1 Tax=Mycolicibacterium sp. P1-18 TaxID=2024615 RepID=UPI0011F3790D|nr:sugar ABC transporter substrate-binding protein [Mycolicibacterium sp. P1-18]KAA0099726.1 sugar ABC transporter substrate-binding protein [Mycolicibacterium sp. P1-18]